MNLIDYSQYSSWNFCPWLWYEKYVRGMSTRWIGQRADNLTLGGLTHEALDTFSKTGRVEISPATIAELLPTAECYNLALLLANGYVAKYPKERWPVERTEQPLRFPCFEAGHEYRYREFAAEGCEAVAKLDGYFYVPEDTTIESGMPGETITLARGWWSREYKTKSAGIPRGEWMQEWATKRQADFQMLALRYFINGRSESEGGQHVLAMLDKYGNVTSEVQGVLVCVLEKPREYVPKRKCRGCGEMYPLTSYLPHADGHMCPMCGAVQQLKKYEPREAPRAEFWRMVVTRNPEQLRVAQAEIRQVAENMEFMRQHGPTAFAPNRDNCWSNRWRRACEFAVPHTSLREAGEPEFVRVEDPLRYVGLSV